jgi:ribosomal protein L40E
MDVATNVICIQNEQPTNIQSRQDSKPSLWQLSSSGDILKLHNDSVNEFQSYKRNVQKQLLEQVLSTSFFEEESMEIKDDMSYYMSDENRGKCVCVKCSEIYPNSVSKCLKCGYIPKTITNKTILYEGVPSKHPDHPPNVKLG